MGNLSYLIPSVLGHCWPNSYLTISLAEPAAFLPRPSSCSRAKQAASAALSLALTTQVHTSAQLRGTLFSIRRSSQTETGLHASL